MFYYHFQTFIAYLYASALRNLSSRLYANIPTTTTTARAILIARLSLVCNVRIVILIKKWQLFMATINYSSILGGKQWCICAALQ